MAEPLIVESFWADGRQKGYRLRDLRAYGPHNLLKQWLARIILPKQRLLTPVFRSFSPTCSLTPVAGHRRPARCNLFTS
jgi:hypothetical protein